MNAVQPFEKIVVVGDGGWGTALAMLLRAAGHDVSIWSYDAHYAALMEESRHNPRYLPGFDLPEGVRVCSRFTDLIDGADLLISAVPTTFLRGVWAQHAQSVPEDLPIVSVSKGLEQGTLMRPTQVLAEVAGPKHTIAVLSGPNIAREIAEGKPAATVVSSDSLDLSRRIQATLSGDAFRAYSNPDLIGVELGGVLKNVIALAAGMCDGMRLGVNAKVPWSLAACSRWPGSALRSAAGARPSSVSADWAI